MDCHHLLMNVSQHLSLIQGVAIEIDPKVVRGEAIRAIRGFMVRSDQPRERLSGRRLPVSFYAIVRIMRDLELTLAAISGSLAEGVEHAAGSASVSQNDQAAAPSAGARPMSTG